MKQIINKSGTGIGYIMTKNILLIEKIKQQYESACLVLNEANLYKNEQGIPEKFKAEYSGNNKIAKLSSDGNPIKADDTDILNSNFVVLVNKTSEYLEAVKQLNQEKYEVDFFTVPENKIESLMESGGALDGVDVVLLFGSIVI